MEAKSATALPPVSAATTSDPHQRRSSVAAAAALIWKAKAAKHYRTHGHLIKLRRAGIDAAGPLRTCWSLGKLSFNFKTIC